MTHSHSSVSNRATTAARPVGVLVIGAGTGKTHGVGTMHLHAWTQVLGARVVAVADINPEAARAGADIVGAAPFTDYREALALPEVDAVDICAPTALHRVMAEDAARAGKHVFVEKPLALSLEDADAIVDACRAAGVVLMVGQSMRYSPHGQLLGRCTADGRLGDPLYVHYEGAFGFWMLGDRTSWQLDQQASGGHMVHNGVHFTDLLLWTFQKKPRQVFAQGRKDTDAHIDVWDRWTLQIVFEDDSVGTVGFARSALPRDVGGYYSMLAIGSKGTLVDGSDRLPMQSVTVEDGIRFHPRASAMFPTMLGDFVEGVRTGRSPISGEEGRAALQLALLAEQSARSGRAVMVDELPARSDETPQPNDGGMPND